jgi:hypothetical protein
MPLHAEKATKPIGTAVPAASDATGVVVAAVVVAGILWATLSGKITRGRR